MTRDEAYQDKIYCAVMQVIVESSLVKQEDGSNVATLKIGEICEALMLVFAQLTCNSSQAGSPPEIQLLGEKIGRRISAMIMRAQQEEGFGWPAGVTLKTKQ